MRVQAVEEDHVPRLVAGRGPAGLGPTERARQAIEVRAGHGGLEGRVGERVHRVHRVRLDRRDAAVVDPPAGSEPGQDGLPGCLDLARGQQAAEEQISVFGQAPAQSTRVIDQGRGIGQLIHRLTVATAGICAARPARPGLAPPTRGTQLRPYRLRQACSWRE